MSDRCNNLLVMLSGSGRTLVNLDKAIRRGDLNAKITSVVASRPCAGVQRANELDLPVQIVDEYMEAELLDQLAQQADAHWVVLAGYLKLVQIPHRLRGRVVNIHPALLPEFGGPGMFGDRVHRAVLKAGKTESGCTVHLCDEHFDTGPIVLQQRCPVLPGDDVRSLAARVFECECAAYPRALQHLINGCESESGPTQAPEK